MSEKKFDFDFRWKDAAGELVADKTAITPDSPLWENVPEKFRPLVTEGGLTASVGSVTASAKVEDGNGKKSEKTAITSYVRLEAETPQAALFLMDNRMKATDDGAGVLTRFNYGFDLTARGEVQPAAPEARRPGKGNRAGHQGPDGDPGDDRGKGPEDHRGQPTDRITTEPEPTFRSYHTGSPMNGEPVSTSLD